MARTEELLARIRSASRRRGEVPQETTLTFADFELDPSTLRLSAHSKEIKLSLKEKELLEQLIVRKNPVTPKDLIIDRLWGFDTDAGDNHVEVFISFLRKKLAFLESSAVITTIRGVGYRLEERR